MEMVRLESLRRRGVVSGAGRVGSDEKREKRNQAS